MRAIGLLLLLAGLALGVFAFTFDISVPSNDGGRIINQGLSADRLIYMLAAVGLFVAGAVQDAAGALSAKLGALASPSGAKGT